MKLLKYFFFLSLFSANAQYGVFAPSKGENENKFVPRQIPEINILFRELSDTAALNAFRKELLTFKKFKKAPFSLDKLVFINPGLDDTLVEEITNGKFIPSGIELYAEEETMRYDSVRHKVNVFASVPLRKLFQPFCICNAEVTNAEYRDFVFYVRDSLARVLLVGAEVKDFQKFGFRRNDTLYLNHDVPVPWNSESDEVKDALQPLYLPNYLRFYKAHEIDTRKLNYLYYIPMDTAEQKAEAEYLRSKYREHNKGKSWQEITTRFRKDVINVYPDTLFWFHDFNTPLTEKFTNMYFWHPAYDHHPVVGLTYLQVRAFLIWKTKQIQRELDKKGIPFVVECDLPTIMERNMVANAEENKQKLLIKTENRPYIPVFPNLHLKADNLISFNVKTNPAPEKKTYGGVFDPEVVIQDRLSNELSVKNIWFAEMNRSLVANLENKNLSFVFPTTCRVERLNLKGVTEFARYYVSLSQGKYSVAFLGSNVSEWMAERALTADTSALEGSTIYSRMAFHRNSQLFPYQGSLEHWINVYRYAVSKSNLKGVKEYDEQIAASLKNNRTDNRLVAGGNFYDHDLLSGNAKYTYLSQDSACSTLGFRYVVRFKEKKR